MTFDRQPRFFPCASPLHIATGGAIVSRRGDDQGCSTDTPETSCAVRPHCSDGLRRKPFGSEAVLACGTVRAWTTVRRLALGRCAA